MILLPELALVVLVGAAARIDKASRGGYDGKGFVPMQSERPVPPTFSGEEARYLRRLAQSQAPVVVYLLSLEVYRGWIEYFDARFIRLTCQAEPNRFIFKDQIKYIAEAKGS